MTKEESTILKGVAILFMVFMHLFAKTGLIEYCTPLFYLNDTPLVNILSRACGPVPFFIILSGYGLQYLYFNNRLNFKSQLRRLLKLYIHFWIILIIFVSIGHFINSQKYPGSIWDVIGNFSSYLCNYNYEHWFLFPYALLSLTAFAIFKFIDKCGNICSLIVIFIVSFISAYFISRYIAANKDYDSVLSHFLTYLSLVFSFAAGSVMCRLSQKGSIKSKYLSSHSFIALLLIIIIFGIRCFFTTSAFHSLYVILFIWLFLHIPLIKYLRCFLIAMGKHSMIIWLTHTFFSNYLFSNFIYGFEYPLIIYVVLLTISYSISFPISWLSNTIYQKNISINK